MKSGISPNLERFEGGSRGLATLIRLLLELVRSGIGVKFLGSSSASESIMIGIEAFFRAGVGVPGSTVGRIDGG